MSKTAAIRNARTHVGMPIRRSSTDYVVYAPYESRNPTGPSTEIQADSYPRALMRRSAKVAEIALHLMNRLDMAADAAIDAEVYDHYADHSVDALVSAGLAAYGSAA